MLKVTISESQKAERQELKDAFNTLEERYNKMKKPDYDEKYRVLLMNESDWEDYVDPVTQKKKDLSYKPPDFTESDIELIQSFNQAMDRVQLRRDIISSQRILAIKNMAKWKTLYFDIKSLQDQMESFWFTVIEIKALKSSELRSSEILLRTADVYELRRKVEVYFKEGKHKDHGEALSYEYAISEQLWNLDSKRDVIKKKFEIFRSKRVEN